ncbi:hypothetical protein D9M72_586440 [compost metagenome]
MHIRQCREALIVKPLKGGQVLGNDVQQVVRLPKQTLGIDHLRYFNERRLERLDGLPVTLAERGKYHCGKIQAQCTGIKLRTVAQQYTGVLQCPHSPMTG